jgi:hypothetical protein
LVGNQNSQINIGDLNTYPDVLIKTISIYSHQNAANLLKIRKLQALIAEIETCQMENSVHPFLKTQFTKQYNKPNEALLKSQTLNMLTSHLLTENKGKLELLVNFENEKEARLIERVKYATSELTLSIESMCLYCEILTNNYKVLFNQNEAAQKEKTIAKKIKFDKIQADRTIAAIMTNGDMSKLINRLSKLETSEKMKKQTSKAVHFQKGAPTTQQAAPNQAKKKSPARQTTGSSRNSGNAKNTSGTRK